VVLQPGPFMRASGFALAGGAAAVVEDAQALVHDIGHQARGMRGARPESEHRVGIRRQGDPQQRLVGVVHQRRIDAVRHVVGEAGKRAADAACGVHQHDVVVSEQQVGGIGEGHVDVATEAGGTGGLDPAAVGSGEVAVQLQAAVRALGEVAIDCQQAVAADQRACVLDIACEGIAEGAQGGARGHVGIAGEDAVHQLQRAGVDVGTAEADLGIAVDGEQAGAVLVQRLGGQDAAVEAPGQAVADIQHHRIGAVAQVDVADGGGAIHQRDQIVTRAQLHGGGAAIHQPAAGEVGGTRGGGGGNAGVAAGDAALVLDGAVGGAGGGEHAELCTADRAAVDQAVARAPPADARAAADDLDAATVGDPVVGAGHQDAVGAWAGAVDAAGVLDHVVRADDLQADAHQAAGRDVAAVGNEVVVAAGIQATGTLPADLDRTGVVQLVAAAGDVAAGCRFAGRGDLAEVVRQVVVAAREQSVRARPAGCDAADIGYLVPGAGAVQAMGPGSAGVDPAGIGVADVLPVTAVVDAAGGTAAGVDDAGIEQAAIVAGGVQAVGIVAGGGDAAFQLVVQDVVIAGGQHSAGPDAGGRDRAAVLDPVVHAVGDLDRRGRGALGGHGGAGGQHDQVVAAAQEDAARLLPGGGDVAIADHRGAGAQGMDPMRGQPDGRDRAVRTLADLAVVAEQVNGVGRLPGRGDGAEVVQAGGVARRQHAGGVPAAGVDGAAVADAVAVAHGGDAVGDLAAGGDAATVVQQVAAAAG